jgi:hypothetical protein
MGKWAEQSFSKGTSKMSKHMNKCSTSLVLIKIPPQMC